jgi:hypothetical protein
VSRTDITRRGLFVAAVGLSVAACGIQGPNKPPKDADPDYPRSYPPPESVRPEGLRPPQPPDAGDSDGTAESQDGAGQ